MQNKQDRAKTLSNYITEGYRKSDIKINAQGQAYVQHKEGQIMLSLKPGHVSDTLHTYGGRQGKKMLYIGNAFGGKKKNK